MQSNSIKDIDSLVAQAENVIDSLPKNVSINLNETKKTIISMEARYFFLTALLFHLSLDFCSPFPLKFISGENEKVREFLRS